MMRVKIIGLLCIALLMAGCDNTSASTDTDKERRTEAEQRTRRADADSPESETSSDSETASDMVTFDIDWYDIRFVMPKGWKETEETQFDLQCQKNNSMNFSVFAYKNVDLGEDQTVLDIYDIQNEDIFSRRQNVKQLEERNEINMEDKTVWTELYSAEYEEGKNYYYSVLIDYHDPADGFAWVLVSAVPSYIEKNRAELDEIIATSEYIGSMDDEA